MQDHVGDSFTGVISTVTNFGMFVRLQDLHIEGLVHITSLGQDFYHFDDVRMCLTGEHSGKKYRVGDEIRVQVAAVNLDEKKIDLRLEGVEPADGGKGSSKGSSKGKSKGKSKGSSKTFSKDSSTRGSGTKSSETKPGSKSGKGKKAAAKDKPKEKSKAKKRSARKKRPGKNARKNAQK